MNGDADLKRGNMADLLSYNWWVLALRGLVAIIFGVLAFIWPGVTVLTLVLLFGAYALLNGILAFTVAYRAPKGFPRFGSLILEGVFSIAAAIFAFFVPHITALVLLVLIACWAIAAGIVEVIAAIWLRKAIDNEWWLILVGVVSIAWGVLLLSRPAVGVLAMVWWIGSFAIAVGVLLTVLAFRMRKREHLETSGTAAAAA